MEDRFDGKVISQRCRMPSKSTCGYPDRQFEVDSTICVHFTRILTALQVLIVNRQGVGSVDGKMVDEAIARKARLILERAGIAAEDQVYSSSTDMKNR